MESSTLTENIQRIHEKDLREGAGRAKLPDAIARNIPTRIPGGMAIRVSSK